MGKSRSEARFADPLAQEQLIPQTRLGRWLKFVPELAILLLVVGAYLPALRGQFIWDDDYNIIKSAPLRTLGGLFRIWFEPGATQQYYPLTHTSFWVDYHLWGLHPLPYHAENILLHALGAILVWRVLRRLSVPGAWLGAALFALHPVCVESVAWITERKNTLCVVFFLGSLLAAIEFWLPRPAPAAKTTSKSSGTTEMGFGPWKFYWLALILYLCALWSKTATLGLPGVILVLAWWKRGRLVRRDAVLLLPFVAVGVGLALITLTIERRLIRIGASVEAWHFLPFERLLIAARALWFYLWKLCWPHPLMFMYPRWQLETASLPGYAALGAGVAGLLLLWSRRQGWGRPVLAAVAYFIMMLFPVLGFVNGTFFRYSFVCDHFQYLAAIGPLALAAAAIASALKFSSIRKPLLSTAVYGSLLLTLGILTWRQTGVYYNLETLWRDSLKHNPDSWMAHNNLANYLCQSGRFAEAETHYQRTIELRPNDYYPYYDQGLAYAMQGKLDQAIQYFTKTLQICPTNSSAHTELGKVLSRKGDLNEAIQEYARALEIDPGNALGHFNLGAARARQGNLDEAIREYTKASQLDPELAIASLSLGNLFAGKGRLDDALAAYTRVLDTDPNSVAAHCGLGRVLAAKGNVEDAIAQYRKALEIEPNSLDALVNLGNALVSRGELDEAVTCYRKALQFNVGSPVIHYNLGVALSRQGHKAEAEAELAEAKRLQSNPAPSH